MFTNENVAGYLKYAGNLDGKDVLTVTASGDQAFEAYPAGARLPRDIKFVHTGIENVAASFDKKYDVIMLSNIVSGLYSHSDDFINTYTDFYKRYLDKLTDKRLAIGGKIFFDYFGITEMVPKDAIQFLNDNIIKLLKQNLGDACPHTISGCTIPSARGFGYIDIAHILVKTR